MHEVIAARALHVLAVVLWMGGVSMVTTVVLPAVRRGDLGPDRLAAFHAIERRFAWQARSATILVGLTGFFMVWRLVLWGRFQTMRFWWMHAMVCLWLLFVVILFVGEPLIRRRQTGGGAGAQLVTDRLGWLIRVHWLLLILSFVTILGAVAGSHGWLMF